MKDDLLTTLVSLTHDISRSLRQEFARTCNPHGANLLQLHALILLNEHTGMTMKEFANAMFITSPSATTFVDRLTRLGWTERRVDPKNRKLVRLALTPTGKRALNCRHSKMSAVIRQGISRISSADQRHLLRILMQFLGKTTIAGTRKS
ncbi:MAG: MarR family transcriptional regulator [Candidatus Peribacteraceae bacterium]|nr:MarR family transcriptional regulator [Candidatus Peribacteraceae bacterium]MDD5075050.1 MarR family transcriptional regulator [Candidatus Peribacteraceae bacterium]